MRRSTRNRRHYQQESKTIEITSPIGATCHISELCVPKRESPGQTPGLLRLYAVRASHRSLLPDPIKRFCLCWFDGPVLPCGA